MTEQQQRSLSDAELMTLFNSDVDLSLLSDEERLRLVKLTDPATGNPSDSPSVVDERGVTDRVIDALPSIGGAVGGLIGRTPVVGSVLSGALGAGGEAIRQAIRAGQGRLNQVGATPQEAVRRMATAGAANAAQEAGGRAVIGGLRMIAPRLMRGALGVQTQTRKEFPEVDLDRVAVRERVIPGSQKSLARVTERGERQAASLRNNLRVADIQAGNTPVAGFDDAVSELRNRVPDARMAARGGRPEELHAVKQGLREVRGLKRRPLNREEAFVTKQANQKGASAAYRAKAGAEGEFGAEVKSDIARGLNNTLKTAVPKHAEDLQRQQELIALERALFNAAPRTSVLRNALSGAAGAGAGTAAFGVTGDVGTALMAGAAVPAAVGALTSPGALSRYALAADSMANVMQGPTARVPDAIVRQQLLQLLLQSDEKQE